MWYHADGALVLCPFHSVLRLVEQGLADNIGISIADSPESVLQRIMSQRPVAGTAHTGSRVSYPRRVKRMSPPGNCDECPHVVAD